MPYPVGHTRGVADRSFIRVKAMVVLRDDSRARQLVTRYPPDLDRPAEFHRLVGGGVELGELARDAAAREVEEELRIRIDPADLAELGVVENIFEFEGERGHEVVFVFSAPVPSDLVPDGGAWFAESDGLPMRVEWRPLGAVADPPLYPEGVARL